MKKIFLCSMFLVLAFSVFAQKNSTVSLENDVYTFLEACELRGLCDALPTVRPYTESYILKCLEQIDTKLNENEENSDNLSTYSEIVSYYKNQFSHDLKGFRPKEMKMRFSSDKDNFKTSFETDLWFSGFASSGFYSDSSVNAAAYQFFINFRLFGDLGEHFSYSTQPYAGLVKNPLTMLGDDYYIGNWWYSTKDLEDKDNNPRTVKSYRNYAFLPFGLDKNWDGSVYHLTSLNANGLTDWPDELSLGLGMLGEIHGSFKNNRIELGINRNLREWAGMDNGASLVLNSSAHPFVGIDFSVKLFDWLSCSALTGSLEAPNQRYINYDAWYLINYEWDKDGNKVTGTSPDIIDTFFFQNLYSLAMLNFDFKYFYADFGTAVVYPKRLELGYAFPMVEKTVYQNNIGDYDNLSLFGNFKFKYPGLGYIWASGYIDEINNITSNFIINTRIQYAYQAGVKTIFPWLPFGTVSFRYTKVEPYCYTHPAVHTPYYDYYVSTAYMNNGRSLGYYLQPNSDEFLFKFEAKPLAGLNAGLEYQLIRHGTDWGYGAVEGSNIYSELVPRSSAREAKRKYFLHDGTYEWMNIVKLSVSYNFKKFNIPLELSGSAGYIYDWFTEIKGDAGFSTPYSYVSNDVYKARNGFVFSMFFTIFGK